VNSASASELDNAKTVQAEQLTSVLPIDLLKGLFVQSHRVYLRITLNRSGMIEQSVAGLQIGSVNLVEPTVFFSSEAFPRDGALNIAAGIEHTIRAIHNAILMATEELAIVFRAVPAQFAEPGGEINIEVQQLVRPLGNRLEIFRMVGNMATLELDPGKRANDVVSLHELGSVA
jgi:hypothetical protein